MSYTLYMISYDDFSKLDIRIGKVLSAERVPETDKLYYLTVDLGEEKPRHIVSGIAQFVGVEDLVGREFPFLANLEPKIIRGLESQGMILAASNETGEFALLSPHKELKTGSKIK